MCTASLPSRLRWLFCDTVLVRGVVNRGLNLMPEFNVQRSSEFPTSFHLHVRQTQYLGNLQSGATFNPHAHCATNRSVLCMKLSQKKSGIVIVRELGYTSVEEDCSVNGSREGTKLCCQGRPSYSTSSCRASSRRPVCRDPES